MCVYLCVWWVGPAGLCDGWNACRYSVHSEPGLGRSSGPDGSVSWCPRTHTTPGGPTAPGQGCEHTHTGHIHIYTHTHAQTNSYSLKPHPHSWNTQTALPTCIWKVTLVCAVFPDWVSGEFLPETRRRLQAAHGYVTRQLQGLGVPYLHRSAGFYVWADLRKVRTPTVELSSPAHPNCEGVAPSKADTPRARLSSFKMSCLVNRKTCHVWNLSF